MIARFAVVLGLFSVLVFSARSETATPLYEERDPIPAEVYIPNAAKRVACFMTINSVEEKQTFTRYLNPADWDLVELVGQTPGAPTSGWIDAVCRSGLQCDIEVVSGHFAGNFFGKSGYTLSLDEMNAHSCAVDCAGILNHPREVYLFGCNTLAGKDHDSRTPQEYFDVLIADGIPRDQAARIVEDRYSPFGQDNRGKMQRSFAGVPYLYGFYSKSPLGAAIQPVLRKYFKSLGDYTAHFDRIVAAGSNAETAPNAVLGKLLDGYNFYQTPGLDPKSPEYEAYLPVCELSDARTPIQARMDTAIELIGSDRLISLLPSLETFFRRNYTEIHEKAADRLGIIQGMTKARETLLGSIDSVFLFATKLRWVRFARELGWLSEPDLDARLPDLVAKKFAETPVLSAIGPEVCGVGYHRFLALDFSSSLANLREEHWRSRSAIRAMGCLGLVRYPAFKTAYLARLGSRSSRTRGDTYALASLYSAVKPSTRDVSDRKLLAELIRACRDVPDTTSAELCPGALANLGSDDDEARALAVKILASAPAAVQATLAPTFTGFEDPKAEIETAFAELALRLPLPYAYGTEKYFESHPLRDPTNLDRIAERLRSGVSGSRKLTGLLLATRNQRVNAAEFSAFWKNAQRRGLFETGEKLLLSLLKPLASSGAEDADFLEVFRTNRYATLGFGALTAELYGVLGMPAVHTHLRKNAESAEILCSIFARSLKTTSYDTFGETIPRAVPPRDCREFIR
jgi:hypothetical protein